MHNLIGTSMRDVLDLELLDRDLFRGRHEPGAELRRALFGGQVAAQALMAAARTVESSRSPHSMHGYFLRPGRPSRAVIFRVERDRDGRSFSSRRVTALQDGEVIFELGASFHVAEEGGTYAVPMLDGVPDPDGIEPDPGFGLDFSESRLVPPTRASEFGHQMSPTMWMRIREDLGDDPLVHVCALTYMSDIGSGFAGLDDPMIPPGGPSLDHAVWFHEPVRADRWLLAHHWPVMAGGGRGLYHGSMHQADGTLGAMLSQEALLRPPG